MLRRFITSAVLVALRVPLIRGFVAAYALTLLMVVLDLAWYEYDYWNPQLVTELPYSGVVAISPDRTWIVSAEGRSTVIKNLHTGVSMPLPQLITPGPATIRSMIFSPSSQYLAVVWYEGNAGKATERVGLLRFVRGKWHPHALPNNRPAENALSEICFSPDGSTLWLIGFKAWRAWEVNSGKLVKSWTAYNPPLEKGIGGVALSPDCRKYYVETPLGYQVWNTDRTVKMAEFRLYHKPRLALDFQPRASLGFYCSNPSSGLSRVVDLRTGREVAFSNSFAGTPSFVDPEGKYLFYGGYAIRDAESGDLKRLLQPPSRAEVFDVDESWTYLRGPEGRIFRQRWR